MGQKGVKIAKKDIRDVWGIYEFLEVSPEIGNIIMAGGNAIAIDKEAEKEGMWDLKRSGLYKVKLGLTSLEEISRIVKD